MPAKTANNERASSLAVQTPHTQEPLQEQPLPHKSKMHPRLCNGGIHGRLGNGKNEFGAHPCWARGSRTDSLYSQRKKQASRQLSKATSPAADPRVLSIVEGSRHARLQRPYTPLLQASQVADTLRDPGKFLLNFSLPSAPALASIIHAVHAMSAAFTVVFS